MKKIFFILATMLFCGKAITHPMPNSVVNFSFAEKTIYIKLEVPILELELAIKKDLWNNEDKILANYRQELTDYFLQHIQIKSKNGTPQPLKIEGMEVAKTSYDFGEYSELVVNIVCDASNKGFDTKDFLLQYDAVIHQVSNHFAVIKIRSDFENGIMPEDSITFNTIQLDIASNTVKPLYIQLEKGSVWKGFYKMIALGMHHIWGGLDHLLFIVLLVLIAPLLVVSGIWQGFGGWVYTFKRLLKIITAFTIGHSLTLLIFSFYQPNGFSYYIEIAITLTIITTAIHALKPLFSQKELLFTLFFGLIHGSAFGLTLNEWGIGSSQKLISLLGFNIGIELMQLLIVLLCLPLIYLSRFSYYRFIRYAVAAMAIVASCFWLWERISG